MNLLRRKRPLIAPHYTIEIIPDAILDTEETFGDVTTRVGKKGWGWIVKQANPFAYDIGEAVTKEQALLDAEQALRRLRDAHEHGA